VTCFLQRVSPSDGRADRYAIKQAIFPPHEKGVKKINGFFVQKTMLFERSEFMVFRKTHLFLAFFVQWRPFLLSFWGCSQKERARAA